VYGQDSLKKQPTNGLSQSAVSELLDAFRGGAVATTEGASFRRQVVISGPTLTTCDGTLEAVRGVAAMQASVTSSQACLCFRPSGALDRLSVNLPANCSGRQAGARLSAAAQVRTDVRWLLPLCPPLLIPRVGVFARGERSEPSQLPG
jgi:hypothetical protein